MIQCAPVHSSIHRKYFTLYITVNDENISDSSLQVVILISTTKPYSDTFLYEKSIH